MAEFEIIHPGVTKATTSMKEYLDGGVRRTLTVETTVNLALMVSDPTDPTKQIPNQPREELLDAVYAAAGRDFIFVIIQPAST